MKKQTLDFKTIGLKVGLEVHQQLSTRTKLFCDCPCLSSSLRGNDVPKEEMSHVSFPIQFTRILRPSRSEFGELDEAAKFESLRDLKIKYYTNEEISCLVEADEEPPHDLNREALETSLIFALALNSKVIDEIHVMRKIVVDGSNTSGFQRTAVVALEGSLRYDSGRSSIAVQSISLEEDAARPLTQEESSQEKEGKDYVLDRLGVPLVEVALAPLERTPEDIANAASTLGKLMRSTGRVARGLGTIRQDLNISVLDGEVIEVKGVQRLDMIAGVVRYEAARQVFFNILAKEITKKIGHDIDVSLFDVTSVLSESKSEILNFHTSDRTKSEIRCIVAKKLSGYLGKKNEMGASLGKELGSIARAYGLGGVLHSDELPDYGITSDEIRAVRASTRSGEDDAFVLVAGSSGKIATCLNALITRLKHATIGIPGETRVATSQGETSFLRPRPGSARMYPETDIPLIHVPKQKLEDLRKLVPKPWDHLVNEFTGKYDLPRQLAEPLFDSDYKALFERIVSATKLKSGLVASTLIDTLQSLSREGFNVDRIGDERLEDTFRTLEKGEFAKEGLSSLLGLLAAEPSLSVKEALVKGGYSVVIEGELVGLVDSIIRENRDLVTSKGLASQNMLMGRTMEKVRGKADGKMVNRVVLERLKNFLGE